MPTYIQSSLCRYCRSHAGEYRQIPLGPLHSAHPNCGLKARGAAFFDDLTAQQLLNFPRAAAQERHLLDELERRQRALRAKATPTILLHSSSNPRHGQTVRH